MLKNITGLFLITVFAVSIGLNYSLLNSQDHFDSEASLSSEIKTKEFLEVDSTQLVAVSEFEGLNNIEDRLAELQASQTQALESVDLLVNQLNQLTLRMDDIESSQFSSEDTTNIEYELDAQVSDYILAEETFFGQDVDSQWDAEMTRSLSDMEASLLEYANQSVEITSQECRRDSCRIEFTRIEDGPPLFPVMLAVEGASKMLFDSVVENGIEKTTVIYQR